MSSTPGHRPAGCRWQAAGSQVLTNNLPPATDPSSARSLAPPKLAADGATARRHYTPYIYPHPSIYQGGELRLWLCRQRRYRVRVAGRTLTIETGKLAEQAGGAVTVRYGDTLILATATASKEPRPGTDFFPLTVDYEQRHYASGKIPGGYPRREGRPSDDVILMCRLTDRPLRPLSPRATATMSRSSSTCSRPTSKTPPTFSASSAPRPRSRSPIFPLPVRSPQYGWGT